MPWGKRLTRQASSTNFPFMATIKISSKVEEQVWQEFKQLARESHQDVSGLLNDAIRDYLQRRGVRPTVIAHLDDSLRENDKLGHLLAK